VKRRTTKWLGCLLAATAIAVTTATAADKAGIITSPDNKDKPSDFYAYYTRLEYNDHNNTGQYADLIVKIGTNGRFVFCVNSAICLIGSRRGQNISSTACCR